MPQRILNEDWSQYDDRKKRDGRDRSKFSCDEEWEKAFLVKQIKKHFPYTSEEVIRKAIESCCGSASRVREDFVKCVVGKL